jgi:hypothetical protein
VESKLELFQTTSKNIESKQQSLEQLQLKISASLSELKQQQEKSEKGTISLFREMNKVVNQDQDVPVGELNHVQVEQKSLLNGMSKVNKIYFTINNVFGVSILGILVYLLMKKILIL